MVRKGALFALLLLCLTACSPRGHTATKPATAVPPELPGALLCMIDNHLAAYPQSGLAEADMVYEVLAEGGITRFLAVFYRHKPEVIGPVRSAREYFAEIAAAYVAPYAHAGGHMRALERIKQLGLMDVDEIYNAGAYFWRDQTRKMPHNLYTSADKLLEWADAHNVTLSPPEGWPGAMPLAVAEQPADWLKIQYNLSQSYHYVPSYLWQNGSYQRLVNGKPHLDSDGQEITAKAVVILEAPTKSVIDQVLISEVALIGRGTAVIFRDGQVYHGEWVKQSPEDHFQFLYQGSPLPLPTDGPIWIQVVGKIDDLIFGRN